MEEVKRIDYFCGHATKFEMAIKYLNIDIDVKLREEFKSTNINCSVINV